MRKKLLHFLRKYKQDPHAATGVEFALVAIPFILFIFGIMEAGRIMWTMNGIQYAVEETSRYAALNTDLSGEDFQSYASEKLSDLLIPDSPLQITFSSFASNGVNFVMIEGEYEISTALNNFLPGNFGNIDYETTARRPIVD